MIPLDEIDLVILDLDGTIIDLFHAGIPSPRVQAAVMAVQIAGIPVTIGTGRTLDYLRQHLTDFMLTEPVITMHGCVIGDPQTGAIYTETAIPWDVAESLLTWLDALAPMTTLYLNDDEGHTHLYQNRLGRDPEEEAFHDHVFGTPRELQPAFRELLDVPGSHSPIKFIIDNGPTADEDLYSALKAAFGEKLYLTRSHPRLVEGMALGVDKGTGLHQVCHRLGIDPQRVLAIGDNDNDIPMLKAAGYAVAMGNGSPGAKAVADWIAPSIREDGAAIVLEALAGR